MKHVIGAVLVLYYILAFSSPSFAGQKIIIRNHSFGIVTETKQEKKKGDYNCQKIAIFIKNENCVGTYKASVGEAVIGEGQIDFRKMNNTIYIGSTKLSVGCQIQGDLEITAY